MRAEACAVPFVGNDVHKVYRWQANEVQQLGIRHTRHHGIRVTVRKDPFQAILDNMFD